jgi:hypothetical protein
MVSIERICMRIALRCRRFDFRCVIINRIYLRKYNEIDANSQFSVVHLALKRIL